MIHPAIEDGPIRIYHGKAEDWNADEKIDLVLTNPYGKMPTLPNDLPMILHQWTHRKYEAEAWSGRSLDFLVGEWNDGREAFWGSRLPMNVAIDISEFRPEPGGWYPEAMVRRILSTYGKAGQTIFDPFMGRGTVAKVARELGMKYVGVEELGRHIAIAVEYLGLL